MTTPLAAATYTVTTTADAGAGSLRQAILDANASAGTYDTIAFAIPAGQCSAAGVCTIQLASSLPPVTDRVNLNGASQPRHGTAPDTVCGTVGAEASYMRVEIRSAHTVFDLRSAGASKVHGFAIGAETGVAIGSTAAHHVYCNHFGLDGTGTTALPQLAALTIHVGVGMTHGGSIIGLDDDAAYPRTQRNLFACAEPATCASIYLLGNDTRVSGNSFGLAADETTLLGCGPGVIVIFEAYTNLVGSDLDGVADDFERNVFAGCDLGILAGTQPATANRIVGNWFGVDLLGRPRPNTTALRLEDGVQSQTVIQGNRFEGNTIGIEVVADDEALVDSDSNCLVGNTIGVSHQGNTPDLALAGNWWGATDGPAGVGPGSGDPIVQAGTGTVTYAPWATAPLGRCGLIFGDGFELGNTWMWSGVVP